MQYTTSATATTRRAFKTCESKEDFLVQVPASSAAGLRIMSQKPFMLNGTETADTTGLTVAAGASIRLPGHSQVWLIGTDTDATAATFEIMAINAERR